MFLEDNSNRMLYTMHSFLLSFLELFVAYNNAIITSSIMGIVIVICTAINRLLTNKLPYTRTKLIIGESCTNLCITLAKWHKQETNWILKGIKLDIKMWDAEVNFLINSQVELCCFCVKLRNKEVNWTIIANGLQSYQTSHYPFDLWEFLYI